MPTQVFYDCDFKYSARYRTEREKLSKPSQNLNEQQRRMQEQQQKMWQDNLRRQQMYVYSQSRQQKKSEEKKVTSCAVCGSVLLIKSCPFCRRFFCNTHLSTVKFGLHGHQCVARKPIPARPSQQPMPLETSIKMVTENNDNKKNEQDELLDCLDRVIEDDNFDFES